jgi:hypothetical protein
MSTAATTSAAVTSTAALPRAASAAPRGHDLGRLLVRCQDRPGIVSAVSTFLTRAGANIVSLGQHATADEGGQFLQRTEFHLPGLPAARDELERSFATEVAERFGMEFRLTEAAKPKCQDKEDLPAPGEIVQIDIAIGPTSTVFEAGHRLVLEVASRDVFRAFPFLHITPENRRTGGDVTLHTGGNAAWVELPVVSA